MPTESNPITYLEDVRSIREHADTVYRMVLVPEWGANAAIRVRNMTGVERASLEKRYADDRNVAEQEERVFIPDTAAIHAYIIAMCAVKQDGTQLFGPEDVDWLKHKNASVLEKIADAAMVLSAYAGPGVVNAAKESARRD